MSYKSTFLFLLAVSISTFQLLSQTFNYPKGAYMSIDEIVKKAPSNDLDLKVIKRTRGEIKMVGGNDYKIVSEDKSVPKKIIRKEILAYSKGDTLYVNGFPYKVQAMYGAVIDDGKYVVFKGGLSLDSKIHKNQIAMGTAFGAIGGAIGAGKRALLRFLYAIDTTTNMLIPIDPNTLADLLKKNNPQLEAQYQKELDKNAEATVLKYLKFINDL